MDWKLFAATFVTIFLAEFGDKTQLAAIAASSQTKSTFTVLLAVCLALCSSAILGIAIGRFAQGYINEKFLKMIAGIAFIAMGVWFLLPSLRS